MKLYKLTLALFCATFFILLSKQDIAQTSLFPSGSLDNALAHQNVTALQEAKLKIVIQEEGFYKISYQDLQRAGFPVDELDPRQLQLTHKGQPVAITVQDETDGRFQAEDYLIFYGQAIESLYTPYNVYWLVVHQAPGLRMVEQDGHPVQTEPTQTHFYETQHIEENHQYWQTLPLSSGSDHWFWQRFPAAPSSNTFTITLHHPSSSAQSGLLQAVVHGRTATPINPDHHSQLWLNGTLLDEAWWDGQTVFTHTATVPQSLWQHGQNQISLQLPGDTGATVDSLYLNYFQLGYWRQFIANANQLPFSIAQTGAQTVHIDGFTQADITLYDLTQPNQVKQLTSQVEKLGEQSYRLRFSDNLTRPTVYWALGEQQYLSPVSLYLDTPSNWLSAEHGADYIIISHQNFVDGLAPLVAHHQSQGLRVVTVMVEDIYDEFSAGIETPHAIRNFLTTAYVLWQEPKPQYVLLVGDANYDFHDFLNTDRPNYIPAYLYSSGVIGQVPSDNWFVSVTGNDPLPEMAIGRLPVRTLIQTQQFIHKIVDYHQNSYPGSWQQKSIFVTDDGSAFEGSSEALIAHLPQDYGVQRIYATGYTQPYDPTADIVESLNRGAVLLNYVGHGNTGTWGSWATENIFRTTDFAALQK